jgi:hypothetical protein
LHKAKKIALGIEKDLAAGSFDTSLHQYKELPQKNLVTSNPQLIIFKNRHKALYTNYSEEYMSLKK